MATKRMSWQQIRQLYPNQWVGLVDVVWKSNNRSSIESAVVKYVGRPKNELTDMMFAGEIVARHTDPDRLLQMGAVGI